MLHAFYEDHNKYITANSVYYFTLPTYRVDFQRISGTLKAYSPLSFIIVSWGDSSGGNIEEIFDDKFLYFVYLMISQWTIADNFRIAKISLRQSVDRKL